MPLVVPLPSLELALVRDLRCSIRGLRQPVLLTFPQIFPIEVDLLVELDMLVELTFTRNRRPTPNSGKSDRTRSGKYAWRPA